MSHRVEACVRWTSYTYCQIQPYSAFSGRFQIDFLYWRNSNRKLSIGLYSIVRYRLNSYRFSGQSRLRNINGAGIQSRNKTSGLSHLRCDIIRFKYLGRVPIRCLLNAYSVIESILYLLAVKSRLQGSSSKRQAVH